MHVETCQQRETVKLLELCKQMETCKQLERVGQTVMSGQTVDNSCVSAEGSPFVMIKPPVGLRNARPLLCKGP